MKVACATGVGMVRDWGGGMDGEVGGMDGWRWPGEGWVEWIGLSGVDRAV